LRGREADALKRLTGNRRQTFQRERQVGAALGVHHGVDLIDYHPAHRSQVLARIAGEQQIERLGRRDEYVGRVA